MREDVFTPATTGSVGVRGILNVAENASNEAVRSGSDPTPDLAATSQKGDVLASIHDTAPVPTSVYRYYDADDMLIYVGITKQGMGRNVQHNGKAEWWPFVVRQEVEHLPNRAAAAMREKELIRRYRPPFNKQHNLDQVESKAAYLAYVASFRARPQSPNALYHALHKLLPLDVLSFDTGRLVMRSQLPHAPLATKVQQTKEIPPLRGRRRKYGFVSAYEQTGPFVTITCNLNKHAPAVGFLSGEALLGWSQNTKPQFPWVRQILVVEADYVPKSKAA